MPIEFTHSRFQKGFAEEPFSQQFLKPPFCLSAVIEGSFHFEEPLMVPWLLKFLNGPIGTNKPLV